MSTTGYQIISIMDEMREMFVKVFRIDQIPVQVLNATSEKPLVVHHKMKQITYVLHGSGNAFFNSDIQSIKEGDLVLIDMNTTHSFAAVDELHLVHWHWPNDWLDEDRIVINQICGELLSGNPKS